jgi:hypothetical protein
VAGPGAPFHANTREHSVGSSPPRRVRAHHFLSAAWSRCSFNFPLDSPKTQKPLASERLCVEGSDALQVDGLQSRAC